MRFNFQFSLLLFAASLLLSKCTLYDGVIDREFIPLGHQTYSKSTDFYLFFENEKIDFDYTKVGYVEIIGERYLSNQELLDQLSLSAWNRGANALIDVKVSIQQMPDVDADGVLIDQSYSKRLTAMAVNVVKDYDFLNSYRTSSDISFVSRMKKRNEKVGTSKNEGWFGLFVVGFSAVLVALSSSN